MKKYIVPTIKIEKVELTEMIATSAKFSPGNSGNDLPTLGTGEAPSTEGDAKRFDVWED